VQRAAGEAVIAIFEEIAQAIPKIENEGRELFAVPLVHLLDDPHGLVQHIMAVTEHAEASCEGSGLFKDLCRQFYENACAVSNFVPYTDHKTSHVAERQQTPIGRTR
jgi:hypothetical protein